ncbi:hypothetical protein ACQY0O_000720 [Thecaphora frezii]
MPRRHRNKGAPCRRYHRHYASACSCSHQLGHPPKAIRRKLSARPSVRRQLSAMASPPASPSFSRGNGPATLLTDADAGADASPAPSQPSQLQSLYAGSKLASSWRLGRRLSSSSTATSATAASWTPPVPSSSSSASATTGASKASNLFQQTTTALQSFALESIISASAAPPRLPISQTKEPLSLPTTTKNFRGFVQKSGALFWLQDGVQATLVWQDASWTLMWMAIWATVSLYPWLLVLSPSAVLCYILISTHRARFEDPMTTANRARQAAQAHPKPAKPTSSAHAHGYAHAQAHGYGYGYARAPTPAEVLSYSTGHPTSTGEGDIKPPLVPNPPHEGSIKYYENLRDIQNMMRLVIDAYDALAPLVPYLNWSSYTRSLHVLQLSLLVTTLLFFIAPYIPYRLLLFVAGEAAFILNHPWTLPALQGVSKRIHTSREGRRLVKFAKQAGHRMREWIEEDRLDDHVWEKGWRNVEMFENERLNITSRSASGVTGTWSAHHLTLGERRPWTQGADGWSDDVFHVDAGSSIDISSQVHHPLEPGYTFLPSEEWRIDWGGSWSPLGVDDQGYLYTDEAWQKPSPYPYGHPGFPSYPPSANEEDEADELGTQVLEKHLATTRRRRWVRRVVYTGIGTDVGANADTR